MDERYVKPNDEIVDLCRAVDPKGKILKSYITTTRDKDAAFTFMKKALRRHGWPHNATTDGYARTVRR